MEEDGGEEGEVGVRIKIGGEGEKDPMESGEECRDVFDKDRSIRLSGPWGE